jgi:hypothetical protein
VYIPVHVVTGEEKEGGGEPGVKSECAEELSCLRFAVTLSWRVKMSQYTTSNHVPCSDSQITQR